MEYAPVAVEAIGYWGNQKVDYTQTFSNRCMAGVGTDGVFDYFGDAPLADQNHGKFADSFVGVRLTHRSVAAGLPTPGSRPHAGSTGRCPVAADSCNDRY